MSATFHAYGASFITGHSLVVDGGKLAGKAAAKR
jgi:hypothetical protein